MEFKNVISINGPVVLAKGNADFAMHDMVYIGEEKLLGEVIKLEEDIAIIQVYESTNGLKIGEKVISDGKSLSVTLAPGLLGEIFDGIQRPLKELKNLSGDFIKKGIVPSKVSLEKKWNFKKCVELYQRVESGTIIGEVQETTAISHKIMIPNNIFGEIIEIVENGEYAVNDIICKVKDNKNNVHEITMIQEWPIRIGRPYEQRLSNTELFITGQRVLDSLFPMAKGGTAMIPGGFGTGKTMLQHQLAKWSNADIIVYIGCGERGNEMTDVLDEFQNLIDPKTGRPLIERTILIANTSNMPVAAREASIYTGLTMAEYYRDMGYDVAIMADSTSRWAEALREISGRLEEMPAEEGYPSYLPSRLSEFYGRAGMVKNSNGTKGSVTIIGAVSPQGADFSEPVTQNTKRFVHCFWGLNRELAYSRHYPAVNWNISYSEYVDQLQDWYENQLPIKFLDYRQRIIKLLEEENELLEISKVVGQDVLSDDKKLVLEICKDIRIGFLQQNAMSEIDRFVPLEKQYLMMDTIIQLYDNSNQLIEKGIPISKIRELGILDEYVKLKMMIPNDKLEEFKKFNLKAKESLRRLEETYKQHIS